MKSSPISTDRNRKFAILMDFDGIVANSEPLYEKVEKDLYRNDFGLTIPDEDWINFKGITEQKVYEILRKRYNLSISFKEAMHKKRDILSRVFASELELFPDFIPFYYRFINDYRFALTTSSAKSLLAISAKKFSLGHYFEVIVCGDDVQYSKPHPQPYLETAHKLGVPPERCVVIEDAPSGIESGIAAGCKVIALTTSLPEKYLSSAHLIRNKLSEISPPDIRSLLSR